jgi:protocatechuate 3,4-dioxygenase beta subunit
VQAGVPLLLQLRIFALSRAGCLPLAGAVVDLWHCNAVGIYSDATDPNFTTVGKKFLRGYQVADATGRARFTTIYPGWYRGRTVHLHFKVRAQARSGRHYEFTSQLYFDDAITDRVQTYPPYAGRGPRPLKNAGDGLFREGGNQLLLALVESGPGYAARFDVALQLA